MQRDAGVPASIVSVVEALLILLCSRPAGCAASGRVQSGT
jgi:hypothetical protein